jgi:hypothetical protein
MLAVLGIKLLRIFDSLHATKNIKNRICRNHYYHRRRRRRRRRRRHHHHHHHHHHLHNP